MSLKSLFVNFLRDVLDEIEDLVTIAIAAGILIIGRFGDKEQFQNNLLFWSGVVLMLMVMAIGNFRDRRRRLQKIHQVVDKTYKEVVGSKILVTMGADEFFRGDREKIQDRLLNATTIDLIGITLSTTVGTTLGLIKNRLKANGKVRLIIVDENSDSVLEQLVKQSWSKKASKEKYRAMIENTSDLLEEVTKEPEMKGSFEIGYLPFIPSVGMILVDSKKDTGAGIAKIYHQLNKASQSFYFDKHEAPDTFDFYCAQFNLMWGECKTNRVKKIV